MAIEFTYIPSKGYSKTPTINKKVISFGDGYARRSPKGINNVTYKWSLNFINRSDTEINEMEGILLSTGGTEYMLWTPPDETIEYKVIASEWSATVPAPGFKSLSLTLSQVHEP